MKVLVTGSDGFVGKYIVAELKNRKHKVIEFDKNKGKDILNKEDLRENLKGIDAVVHLAAIIDNSNSKLWEVNVNGTKKVFAEAKKARVKKFVLLSSTGVYGETKGKVSEEILVAPENNYEKSKVAAEEIVLEKKGKMGVCVVRSAMVFGPNEYWEKMFKMLKKNFPLPCRGNNHFQVIYVQDLAEIIALVLEKGKNKETYLVSGMERLTLKEFCIQIKKEFGLKEEMKTMNSSLAALMGKIFRIKVLNSENIRHLAKERDYDTTKIEKLGWKQKRNLKEEIIETIEMLKEENID